MFACPAVGSRADAGARIPAEPLEPPAPGPPTLEPAKLGPPSEERAVAPAGPSPAAEPASEPAEPEPDRPFSLDAAKAVAASLVPAQRAALALALLKRSLRAFDPSKLPGKLPTRLASKLASQASAQTPRRSPDGTRDSEAGPATTSATAASASMAPSEPDTTGPGVLDVEALDRIRLEIKARLPYFQACADASRRRGGPEVRRLQAVWTIGPDGSIRDLKVENVDDAQLVGCITRMGGRPFAVKPGADLTIPTPIVFVR